MLWMAGAARADLSAVTLLDFEGMVSQAGLLTDDAGFTNPGSAGGLSFDSWVENGVTIAPAAGQFAFYSNGNALGLRFAASENGYGDGTAVLTFDSPQSFLGVEGGFSQPYMRIAVFEDVAGSLPLGALILGDGTPNPTPFYALHSTQAFARAEVQHVNALGEIQNSNQISDLRFSYVPEPPHLHALALAVATLTWLRRSR